MSLIAKISISLDEAKNYLRVDHEEDDWLIEKQLEAACDQAEDFIGHDFPERVDNIPANAEIAVMRILASLYENRDDETVNVSLGDESKNRGGSVERTATKMLSVYRVNPGF
jgi:uncharacterized phage protein (predicted DNA packaging)